MLRVRIIPLLSISLCLIMARAARAAEADPLAAAQADYAAGQYRPCLQKIAAALAGPASKAGSPQRYDLFMLRGDSLLQLKQASLAAGAYDSAARAVKDDADLKRIAAARASSLLIKASSNLTYKPSRAADSGPIDIVAPESRRKAMAAMLQNQLAALMPRVDSALQSTTLKPMYDLLPQWADAYMIELAATGEATQTLPIAKSLGERARHLISQQLDQFAARANELFDLASEPTMSSGSLNSIGIRGLTSPERDELQQMADEVTKIQKLAQQGGHVNRRLGGNGEAWDTILVDCDDVADRLQRAFDKKY